MSKNTTFTVWQDIEERTNKKHVLGTTGPLPTRPPSYRCVTPAERTCAPVVAGRLLTLKFPMGHGEMLTCLTVKCQNLLLLVFGCHTPFSLPGYHGPLDLYPEFYRIATDPTIHTVPEGRPVNVCVGKEWYRFPSSFLLPDK